MSAFGTKRLIAATQQFGRFRTIADIARLRLRDFSSAGSVRSAAPRAACNRANCDAHHIPLTRDRAVVLPRRLGWPRAPLYPRAVPNPLTEPRLLCRGFFLSLPCAPALFFRGARIAYSKIASLAVAS